MQLVRDMFGTSVMAIYIASLLIFLASSGVFVVGVFLWWPGVPSLAIAAYNSVSAAVIAVPMMAFTVPLGSPNCFFNRVSLLVTTVSFWVEFSTDFARCASW